MSVALAEAVSGFAGRRIAVIGEAMLDAYLEGETDRFCQEAPVPIVNLIKRREYRSASQPNTGAATR